MAFSLDKVVPWGRNFGEYCRMFDLGRPELAQRLLGCGDGPASFNSEATRRGVDVTSVDPLYCAEAAAIRQRIEDTADTVVAQLRDNLDDYVWSDFASVDALRDARLSAMQAFLDDFQRPSQRYVAGELPNLPFNDDSFDLALCSHFLFLYSDQLSETFHRAAIEEMLRVAPACRIFPLVDLACERSRHLDAIVSSLRASGYSVTIQRVEYEFQRGGDEMLQISRAH